MGFHPADIPGPLPDLLRGLRPRARRFRDHGARPVIALPVALARMSSPPPASLSRDRLCPGARAARRSCCSCSTSIMCCLRRIRLDPWTAGIVGMSLAYSPISPRSTGPASRPSNAARPKPAGDRHVARQDYAHRHHSPGDPHHHPADRQHLHRPVQGHVAAVDPDYPGIDVQGQLFGFTTFQHITIFLAHRTALSPVCWPSAAVIDHFEARLKAMPHDPACRAKRRRWWLPFAAREAKR